MSPLHRVLCVAGVSLSIALGAGIEARGQTAESLSQVRKIFVDSLGTEEGGTELRNALIKALRKNKSIQIVETANEADAVIKGTGKIWVTGYIHVGPHGGMSEATYDGYLQAVLKGKDDKTLWSRRVTPSKFPWNGIVPDLAGHFANELSEALRQNKSFELRVDDPARV